MSVGHPVGRSLSPGAVRPLKLSVAEGASVAAGDVACERNMVKQQKHQRGSSGHPPASFNPKETDHLLP